jgi:hypothetical protein
MEKANSLETYKMLHNGAVFNILKIINEPTMDKVSLEEIIRRVENEYIELYSKDSEWNVINKKFAHCHLGIRKIKPKAIKYKTIKIKVKESDYDKVMELLIENDLL